MYVGPYNISRLTSEVPMMFPACSEAAAA